MATLLTNFVFGERFKQVTDEWKERTGQDLKVLAIDTKIPQKDISRYRSGDTVPKGDRLLRLCEYLGVSPVFFGYDEKRKEPSFDVEAKDRYKDDPNYQKAFIEKQKKAKQFGLSEDFLRWIKHLDCTKKMFPLYRDHVHDISLWLPDGYKRRDREEMISADVGSIDEAEIEGKKYFLRSSKNPKSPDYVDSPYQVSIEGKTYTLRYPDYAFISELQKYLADCAELFMAKRNWEMHLEDEEVNKRSLTKTEDGGTMFTPLSEQELQEIDPYRHHLYFKKEKRSK